MLKTILVVYTDTLLEEDDIKKKKKYAFNTTSKVKKGDGITTEAYDAKLQVVKVFKNSFMYYDASTGELFNELTYSGQWRIKEISVKTNSSDSPEDIVGAFWTKLE